ESHGTRHASISLLVRPEVLLYAGCANCRKVRIRRPTIAVKCVFGQARRIERAHCGVRPAAMQPPPLSRQRRGLACLGATEKWCLRNEGGGASKHFVASERPAGGNVEQRVFGGGVEIV